MKLFASKHEAHGHWHFCPGCAKLHRLPSEGWTFNGDLDKPTFAPSFKHSWGAPANKVCHYIVTDGRIFYCGDSTHALAGQTIDFPDLPDERLKHLQEGDF